MKSQVLLMRALWCLLFLPAGGWKRSSTHAAGCRWGKLFRESVRRGNLPRGWSFFSIHQLSKKSEKKKRSAKTVGGFRSTCAHDLEGTPLMKMKNAEGNLRIDSTHANDFLSHSRPKRSVEPKWYRGTPDFQSYYRFYNSIGHTEGLYEIDRIRMLYQQMRHLEVEHGADASSYQNALGVPPTTPPPPPTTQPPPPPPTTTQPPPPPTTTVDPLADADIIFLCNPKDKLCRPSIVYLPAGGVPVLCDPRYDPACRPKTEEELLAEVATQAPPPPAPVKVEPAPTTPPPPPPPPVKGMEYDCDPYWDPDCLIDHPPRVGVAQETTLEVEPAQATPPVKVEEEVKAVVVEPAQEKISAAPLFDPYDWKRDLFDPNAFAEPDVDEE